MEEEVGIKVTRLRRRLSVEADDVKSPSTPTKKRGGRLAAKPQLELIDENTTEAATKKARKSTVKDIAQPVEEKAVTPSRRSTRIRSNTSIVSETPAEAEDKGTPSRRSTRIKSNTSIVAETVQNVNSPRAKRAARRTSLAGSDNEAPVTPARQTRRTRKDSTSSVDKQAEPNAGILGSQVNDVIIEESENNLKEIKNTDQTNNILPSPRKSPRLVVKLDKNDILLDSDNKGDQSKGDEAIKETIKTIDKTESKTDEIHEAVKEKTSEQNNLSVSSSTLINGIDEAPKNSKLNLNKSTTAVEEPKTKSKRNRTKSWTTISVEPSIENSFCSDTEATKKKNKRDSITLNISNISGSGDGIMNISNKNEPENKDQENAKEISLNSSTISEKKKKKRYEKTTLVDTETSVHELTVFNTSGKLNKSTAQKSEEALISSKNLNSSGTDTLFKQAPIDLIQTLVYIEDSDSNSGSNENKNIDKEFDSGDQCVPVVDHHLADDETCKETKNNLSYEPMDIDETMPENVSLTSYADNNNSLKNDKEPELEKRKSILNVSQVKDSSINKSKRKSIIPDMTLDNNADECLDQSKKQSSVMDTIDNDLEKDINKSNRKTSLSTLVPEDTVDGVHEISIQADAPIDENMNKKSRRKSSLRNVVSDDNVNNKSIINSSTADTNNDESSVSNKSKKRNSSISIAVPDKYANNHSNKSIRKSSMSDLISGENIDESLNKSKNQYLIATMAAEDSIDKRKSLISDTRNDNDSMINKSSSKSSTSKITNDNILDKSSNKSISKSSILAMDSQALDKTENENKSTLILSQIKDMSESEINVDSNFPIESNESVEKLSKSVDVPSNNANKVSDKKNLSLTYSTSTPLQQKSIQKLGMQINSSIIALNSASKAEKKGVLITSKKEVSIMSQKNDSDSSEDEDSEEESSLEKSKMIDDEAEEASDDYQSGDSRDEDEREYEKQNEIVEKGETLDSDDEEEYSDDSDYEKGSFIVSSNEEDNDLLSGSSDDLSMSADELSMSAKSKKKYNERKLKEQKKASREMFEARHKLNESDKKKKSKKNKRQQLESSSSESDEEVTVQPKKNRRQRIDSSQDINAVQSDADKSVSKIKKKVRRLSESVCDDNAIIENEITIREETQTKKDDPLALQIAVKEEPKTPQKDLNISIVTVTNIEEVEEVNIDENVSINKAYQTTDPLYTTMAQDDLEDDDNDDSISENEEITYNYESILKNLNKANSKKIKSLDISLNLNKKEKQVNEPIVDQLNLTQGKRSKKKKVDASENNESKKLDRSLKNKSTDKIEKQVIVFSEGSSDSIDMKLLFPDESNDSEAIEIKVDKQEAKKTIQIEDVQNADSYIPLKRTEGKTNILENIDNANKSKNDSVLNISNKKKNKRKSSQTEEPVTINDEEGDNVSFFFDTTGTHTEVQKADANTSIKNSAKKKNKQKNKSFANVEEDNSNDAPLEVSYRSEKNKSKQDLSMTQIKDVSQADTTEIPSQSAKKKKKNKKGINSSQNATELSNEKTENEAPAELEHNSSLGSANKQKAISDSCTQENEIQDDKDVVHEEETSKKRKRKSSANQISEEIDFKDDIKLNTSKTLDESFPTKRLKKKPKISRNDEGIGVQNQDTIIDTQKQEKVPVKNAKTKKSNHIFETDEETTRKNKKRKERDDDDASKISKILKQDSFDKVHVPRFPANVLKQLDDKPKINIIEAKKSKVISTTSFMVEQAKTKRSKPSNYLEESIYINDDLEDRKSKGSIKNPKVLPFIPTASTSGFGFTTNFRVNIIPQQTQFVAQSNEKPNFKNDYLNKKRIKKLGTFEMYKRQRSIKLTKF